MNLHDPVNGPSFLPSPLKQLPWFLQHPKHVNDGYGPPNGQTSNTELEQLFPQLEAPPNARLTRTTKADAWTTESPSHPATVSSTSERGTRKVSEDAQENFGDYTYTGPLTYSRKPMTLITEEPLQRPSSRLMALRRRSETHASAYMTPPEYSTTELDGVEMSSSHSLSRQDTKSPPAGSPDRTSQSHSRFTLHEDASEPLVLHQQPHHRLALQEDASEPLIPHLQPSRAFDPYHQRAFNRTTSRINAANSKRDASASSGSLQLSRGIGSTREGRKRSIGSELKRFFTGR